MIEAVPVSEGETKKSALEELKEQVSSEYGDEIAVAVHAGLGVIASLSLQKRDHCLVLVYVGASSGGKSTVTRMFFPLNSRLNRFLHRVDVFTPASFVSNASNRKEEALLKIDLLPKIRGKTMVTKELSALFGEKEDGLIKTFGTLTTVLDGNGLKTSSGTHGERGYEGNYCFNWIGATTPVPKRVHSCMSQCGNRILFYRLPVPETSDEKLLEFAERSGTGTDINKHSKLCNEFVEEHFKRFPVDTVDPKAFGFPKCLRLQLIKLARLIAKGRVLVEKATDSFETGVEEAPHRLILLLNTFVYGLALVAGRKHVTEEDIAILRHVAFSSLPDHRSNLLKALIDAKGCISSTNTSKALGVSRNTAKEHMGELAATGLALFEEGDASEQKPALLRLAKEWEWLLGSPTPINFSDLRRCVSPLTKSTNSNQ